MLIDFPGLRGAAHGEVLDRAAETAHRVPLEVGQNDHRIGGKERLRNLDRSEMFQVDGHFLVALAGHAVGHDHRSVHDIGRKTVAIRRFQMIHGVMAGGLVERAGIRQERAGPRRLHAIHDLPHERRVQVGIVARFAEVQLDGNDLILADRAERLHLVRKPHGVAEPLDLGEPVIGRIFYSKFCQINGNRHTFSLFANCPAEYGGNSGTRCAAHSEALMHTGTLSIRKGNHAS